MPLLLNEAYEYFILDFGCSYKELEHEFLRCDRKLVLGSLSPWHISEYETFLECTKEKLWGEAKIEYFAAFSSKIQRKEFRKRYHTEIEEIPFFFNPLKISREQFAFFESLL